jgi:hypothetical protein
LYSLAVVVELVVVVEMFVVKQSCKSLPSKMALKYFNATVPDDVDDGGDLDVDDDLMTAFVTAAVADVTAKRHNKFMSCEVALYKKSFCSFAMDESVDVAVVSAVADDIVLVVRVVFVLDDGYSEDDDDDDNAV